MARGKATADRDQTRTFPAFPPRPGRGPFADTWWGEAWIEALEQTSLDQGRLSRGRTYARRGDVAEITVSPGLVRARVYGSRPTPYRTRVAVTTLDDDAWHRLLDALAARAGHLAALLDRDMPPELAEDAERAGVRLLPRTGDLEPSCDCPDWGWPCKHAAALCYQVARLLDADPFVLLLLRGRGEHELMTKLRQRNARHLAAESSAPALDARAAVRPAREVFASWQAPTAPLPEPERVTSPGPAPVLAASSEADGTNLAGLEVLAADAAARAAGLLDGYLTGDGDAALVPELSQWQDTVRLAAAHQDVRLFARLCDGKADQAGRLALAVRAWRYGGPAGLEVLESVWTPPVAAMSRARAELRANWESESPPTLTSWRNRWTSKDLGVQLRYGRDGRWYPYRRYEDGLWWPAAHAVPDPATALASLLG